MIEYESRWWDLTNLYRQRQGEPRQGIGITDDIKSEVQVLQLDRMIDNT